MRIDPALALLVIFGGLALLGFALLLGVIHVVVRVIRNAWKGPIESSDVPQTREPETGRSRLDDAHDALVERVERLERRRPSVDVPRLQDAHDALVERVQALEVQTRRSALKTAAAYPAIHTVYEFKVKLLNDKLANRLGLTAEERVPPRGAMGREWALC